MISVSARRYDITHILTEVLADFAKGRASKCPDKRSPGIMHYGERRTQADIAVSLVLRHLDDLVKMFKP